MRFLKFVSNFLRLLSVTRINKLMKRLRLLALFLSIVMVGWARAQGMPSFTEKEIAQEQLGKLRDGGYVIYMRHGKTDPSQPDLPNVVFNDCSTQRLLSDEGRKMAAEIGKYLRSLRIPIQEIYVSPMCRTRESARLVFGPEARLIILNELFSSTNQTSEQKKPIIATTRRLLSEKTAAGSNRFILAHAPNLADTMGYFPKAEATVVIFKPLGNSFEYIGSIRPEQWPGLLR